MDRKRLSRIHLLPDLAHPFITIVKGSEASDIMLLELLDTETTPPPEEEESFEAVTSLFFLLVFESRRFLLLKLSESTILLHSNT